MHYQFDGSLTTRDCKRHISHRFELPPNDRQVDMHFCFSPHRVHGLTTRLTLTVFDPAGFRGAGHRGGASHRVHISAVEATPGYLPGPLPNRSSLILLESVLLYRKYSLHFYRLLLARWASLYRTFAF